MNAILVSTVFVAMATMVTPAPAAGQRVAFAGGPVVVAPARDGSPPYPTRVATRAQVVRPQMLPSRAEPARPMLRQAPIVPALGPRAPAGLVKLGGGSGGVATPVRRVAPPHAAPVRVAPVHVVPARVVPARPAR